MRKKAAIELSVNFLVLIIISLVIFGFGIKFIYDIYSKANDISKTSQDDLDRKFSELNCNNNEKVCMNNNIINTNTGMVVYAGVKITNIKDDIPYFRLEIKKGRYIDVDKNLIEPSDSNYVNLIQIEPQNRTEEIKPNEFGRFGFAFDIPNKGVKKGSYNFELNIYKGSSPVKYDRTQIITIIVK
jgi:hypothetical protein